MTLAPSRDEEIKAIWKEYKFIYQVLGGILLGGIGVLIGAIFFSAPDDRTGYLINLYTSILSIIVTVFVIDLLNRRRDERNAVKQLQEQLVRDASSIVNDVANNAIHQMGKRDWLTGDNGLLIGANLRLANLRGAFLSGANLQGANLLNAYLQGAVLYEANLQGAVLREANLQETVLIRGNLQGANLEFVNLQGAMSWGANLQETVLIRGKLQGADLEFANLQGADLREANLQGADLEFANLQGAVLVGTKFDEVTILPDKSHWTPDTDMTKFTDPDNKGGSE